MDKYELQNEIKMPNSDYNFAAIGFKENAARE
jgi:hypothetical protein